MTGTAFYTRPQWLTDEHIAHSYMTLADGSRVDAVRNLDKGSPYPYEPGKNLGRSLIDAPGTAASPPRRIWSGSHTRCATARCWVGVILSNYDNLPLQEIGERENQAITGQR